ncbi:MAG: hypothetical protein BAJATHORv1_10528 [Candidatus Thorarchaeota archaeon]|nr:MAG: hypothetical protein BAJATHORv1_10528 [Candidatus Thorarchaeota archaeon]
MTSIRIQCPVCQKVKVKEISDEITNKSGISSVLVPADNECDHSLVVFVDSEQRVRRVQQLDYAPTGASGVVEVKSISGMTLRGLRRVLGPLLTSMISALLERKKLVLCNDVEVGISAFGSLNRIFTDDLELGKDIIVVESCSVEGADTYVVDTQVPQRLSGKVGSNLSELVERYLDEALDIVDNEASIIMMRQKTHNLDKAAEAVEAVVSKKMSSREVMKKVKSSFRINLSLDELRAAMDILDGRGVVNIKELITVSGLDDF